jgi:hypothetical protein
MVFDSDKNLLHCFSNTIDLVDFAANDFQY